MRLVLPLSIWQQIQGYAIAASPNEITGLGTIKQRGRDFVVDEIFVPEQRTSAAYCETKAGALNDIILNLIEDNPARAGQLRFRWHSHVTGNVYWSATDEADIAATDASWVVNLVVNVRGDKKARLDVFAKDIQVIDAELEVHIEIPAAEIPATIAQKCMEEVSEKVELQAPPMSAFGQRVLQQMQSITNSMSVSPERR